MGSRIPVTTNSITNRNKRTTQNIAENTNTLKSKNESQSIEDTRINIKNDNKNTIGQSGNSDVDVHVDVHVDTTAIGFAILCSLLATKQMSNSEFEEAVNRLQQITQNKFVFNDNNSLSTVKLFEDNHRVN
ncbi:hypothetical protein P9D39_26030 [Heyndrickxia oleronia]|uniref:hypothetical protein n=1 Tax=Heyndrickxia oleronia TaxID=38875 RepID=UPI001ADF6C24|nr:hypothetical protein [Heyndrickxia oleronia]MEC1377677.1 hypothetical protein [Heyndrickxia oleronia]QQZ06903.1 hypothetical protein I5818_11075 [Heyndrickxia oleronia]